MSLTALVVFIEIAEWLQIAGVTGLRKVYWY